MHKTWIKNSTSFLYHWFPTLSSNKGVLKAKGGLAKMCHVSIKRTRHSTTHKTKLSKICRQLFWHIWPTADLFQMDYMPSRSIGVWTFRQKELHIWKFNKSSYWIHNKGRTHAKDHTINKASLAEVLLGWQIKLIEQQSCQQSEYLMPQMCIYLNTFFKLNQKTNWHSWFWQCHCSPIPTQLGTPGTETGSSIVRSQNYNRTRNSATALHSDLFLLLNLQGL